MLNLARYAGMAALVVGLAVAATTKPASAWDYGPWSYGYGPYVYGFAYPYPSYGYHPYHPHFYGYYGYQPFYYYRVHPYRRW